jgi:hypothetical protein
VTVTDPGPCPGCGLIRPPAEGPTHAYIGASAGCWALFTEVSAREYGDPERWAVHPLTVDAYAVQHPGTPSRRAIQSVGVHLITLCLVLERDLPLEKASRIRAAAADRLASGMTWLEPPEPSAASTIADVAAAADAAGHRAAVRSWAQEVWVSWAPHHETVRKWIDWLVAASPPDFTGAAPRMGPAVGSSSPGTPPTRRTNGAS